MSLSTTNCLDSLWAISVEVTSNCNLKCRMCPLTNSGTFSSLQPGPMQDEVWEKICELGQKVGVVIFGGFGETLMNPRFPELLQELDRLGVYTSFSTNGVSLKPFIVDKLNRLDHLWHINVSIDSPVPEIYRRIRGGSLPHALTGLETLMAKFRHSELVSVSSIVTRDNIESLGKFPAILSKLGVKTYILQPLIDWNPDLINQHIAFHRHVGNYLNKIKTDCAEYRIVLNLPSRLELEVNDPQAALATYHRKSEFWASKTRQSTTGETRQCTVPWEIPFINKDGQVFPCCNSAAASTELMGDLRKQSFDDIWNGENFKTFRKNLLSGDNIPSICQSCTVVAIGQHPFKTFSASILEEFLVLSGDTIFELVVENTGTVPWTKDLPIRIETCKPRSRESNFYNLSWLSSNRICSFVEDKVLPGGRATFKFEIQPTLFKYSEKFQIVVDGIFWIPNTQFELTYEPKPYELAWILIKRFYILIFKRIKKLKIKVLNLFLHRSLLPNIQKAEN